METENITDFVRKRKALASQIASKNTEWQEYCEYIFRDDKGKRIQCPEHQIEIFKFVDGCFDEGQERVSIEAPWGHGKTQSLALFYPSRVMGMNPKSRIKICSANDSIATLRVTANKNTIELNEDYRRTFPYMKPGDKWGESAFRVRGSSSGTTDYTMQAGGVNSSIIGGRADLLILDDPCDLNNSITDEARQKTAHTIRMQWMSRLAPQGRIIWIGTPWHREDAMQTITKEWQRLKICVSEDVHCLEMFINDQFVKQLPLWHDVWSRKRLLAERDENEKAFNVGFRLIPITDEDASFKHVDKAVRWNTDPRDYEYVGIWGGLDISTKKRPGTVGTLVGINTNYQRVLIDIVYLDDPVKIKALFHRWYSDWGNLVNFINVENNAIQDVLVDILANEDILPVRGFTTSRNKSDIYTGIPVLDTRFEKSALIIPVPHDNRDCGCPRCRLIRALRLHPYASETDSVMSLWFADRATMYYQRVPFA